MSESSPATPPFPPGGDVQIGFLDLLVAGAENLKWLVGIPVLAALIALGLSYAEQPKYAARAVVLPLGVRGAPFMQAHLFSMLSPSAQADMQGGLFVNLMESNAVLDALVQEHGLQQIYGARGAEDARRRLSGNSSININPRDGSIIVEVSDADPQRAAALANGYVRHAMAFADELGLTEAQQRRIFFGERLREATFELADARRQLQAGAAKPRADGAPQSPSRTRIEAELRAAEVSLKSIEPYLSDASPQVLSVKETIQSLKRELASLPGEASDEKAHWRRVEYFEMLTAMLLRQYEAAQIDESRTGRPLHVVDEATPPETPVRPKRLRSAVAAALGGAAAVIAGLLLRAGWRNTVSDPLAQSKLRRLRAALSFRRA